MRDTRLRFRLVGASMLAIASGTFLSVGGGCQSAPPRTSRVQLGDMRVVVEATVEQLASSDWLADRVRESPDRIVIGVERVENRSSDVITRSEQWYLMQSVANRVVSTGLGRAKKLSMVIPAERLAQARVRSSIESVSASDREVTHSMTAAIESITRSGSGQTSSRVDFYSCVYRVVDLSSGEIVWEDRVEFSREAFGRSFH